MTNISADEFFPACSYRSTSINCLRGTKKGLSALGDLVVDSFYKFEQFYNEFQPAGVEKAFEYQLWTQENADKWSRRYPESKSLEQNEFLNQSVQGMDYFVQNEAYLIDPYTLEKWYRNRYNNIKYETGLVKEISQDKTVVCDLWEKQFDYIFICTNYATSMLAKGFSQQFDYYLDHCKPVAGSYLEIPLEGCDFSFDHSFSLALDKYHFIYRQAQQVLQIGSSTDNRCDIHLANEQKLQEIYQFVASALQVQLPPFESFKSIAGVRHKGHKRMPFWGEISQGIYSVCGLYKNAYTFAYQAANELGRSLGKT